MSCVHFFFIENMKIAQSIILSHILSLSVGIFYYYMKNMNFEIVEIK